MDHIKELIQHIKNRPKIYMVREDTELLFHFLLGYCRGIENNSFNHDFCNWIVEWIKTNIDNSYEASSVLWYKILRDVSKNEEQALKLFFDLSERYFMLKTVREILERRVKLHPEDYYRIEQCWNELIDALSQDEWLTIDILHQLNEEEFAYISEVFEDIAYNLQSVNYINCLKEIERKFPSLERYFLRDFVENAEKYIL